MEGPLAAGSSLSERGRPLERLLILGRPGIELVVGLGLFGAVELQDRISPHFPHAALSWGCRQDSLGLGATRTTAAEARNKCRRSSGRLILGADRRVSFTRKFSRMCSR